MIRSVWLSLLLVCAISAPSASLAGPITASVLDSDDMAWFYNRPGASVEAVNADHVACIGFGAWVMGGENSNRGPSQYGLTGDIMAAIAVAGLAVAATDECMISKGYRRFDLPDTRLRAFRERLAAMSPEQQQAYLGGEVPPEGVLARVWVNDYWLASDGLRAPDRNYTPTASSVQQYNEWGLPREIDAVEDFAAIAPTGNQAVVFMTMRAPRSRAYVLFDRRDPVTGHPSRTMVDGRDRFPGFEAETAARAGSPDPVRVAFVIPEGTYSLAMARSTRYDGTTFCLGTIAFDIRAGEAVDLGEFTLEPGDQVVDPLSPPPQVRFRIDQPAVDGARASTLGATAFADRLRPAAYVNNFPRNCQLFARIYGFDMPGAPLWAPPS